MEVVVTGLEAHSCLVGGHSKELGRSREEMEPPPR